MDQRENSVCDRSVASWEGVCEIASSNLHHKELLPRRLLASKALLLQRSNLRLSWDAAAVQARPVPREAEREFACRI